MAVLAEKTAFLEFRSQRLPAPKMASGEREALRVRIDMVKAKCGQACLVSAAFTLAALHHHKASLECRSRLAASAIRATGVA
jgi:hypothetical protein